MGHDHIAILDGGLPEWIQKGFQTKRELMNHISLGILTLY